MKYKIVRGVWTPKKPKTYWGWSGIIILIATSILLALIIDKVVRPAELSHCLKVETNKLICENI